MITKEQAKEVVRRAKRVHNEMHAIDRMVDICGTECEPQLHVFGGTNLRNLALALGAKCYTRPMDPSSSNEYLCFDYDGLHVFCVTRKEVQYDTEG